MQKLWNAIGAVCFWLAWPALFVYLRFGQRTRVVIEAEGKILLVKGWLGAGDWELPGGGLHRGEGAVAGATREVAEETGLRLETWQLEARGKVRGSSHGLSATYVCFVVHLPQMVQVRPRPWEIREAAWLDPAQIDASYRVAAASRTIIQDCLKLPNLVK